MVMRVIKLLLRVSEAYVSFNRYLRSAMMWAMMIIAGMPNCRGQVTPFEKSVMDSLQANDFNASFAFAFNASQDGTRTLTLGTDAGLMYSTQRSNYELLESGFHNKLEQASIANRFFTMIRGSLFSHYLRDDSVLVENANYPEPFALYSYDANRGLNARWQFGIDAVHAFKNNRLIRITVGIGLLYELENWQMIKTELLPKVDSFPEAIQRYLFDTVGINSKGQLLRNNVRLNLYANFICTLNKNVGLNAFVNWQQPFEPPYKDLPSNDLPQAKIFPINTRLYPRITIDAQLTIAVWGKLKFVTAFSMQYDKGQLPLYAPDFIYNLTEGLQFDL